jgi:hypothetical protein
MNDRRELSIAQLEQRRQAATIHGAKSEIRIAVKTRNAKRRFLTRQQLRARDLDGIALAYLDGWARATAKVELWDSHDPLGAGSKQYIAASNSARLFMAKLEARLRVLNLDKARPARGRALEEHLARHYANNARGDA